MLFDDGVYLVISEIYSTRQLDPTHDFIILLFVFAYLFNFIFIILTVKF